MVSIKPTIKLGQLAKKIGAVLDGDPDFSVSGLNTLSEAREGEVSFFVRKSFLSQLENTKAGAVIISKENSKLAPCHAIIGEDPYLLYAKATQIFKNLDKIQKTGLVSTLTDISTSAKISSTANIGSFTKIGEDVEIEEEVDIGSGVVIGDFVKIGRKTTIYPNVSIYDSVSIGSECIIHSGTVIGSDGLGFAREDDHWIKVEHLGRVIIEDKVEIGSNCSIDRGSVGDTLINKQVKIDNLVHIAHNVSIGSCTAIAANSAIAGSTSIGRNCTIAGCCGIVDNIEITDSVNITAMTLVTKSIKNSGTYSSGTPLMENKEWRKNAVAFKKIKDLISR